MRIRPAPRFAAAPALLALLAAFGHSQEPLPKDDLGDIYPRQNVLGLPKMHSPRSNLLTESGFELGRGLFFDPVLSIDRTLSCASCHRPDHAFTSPSGPPIGAEGWPCEFDTPSLYNLMWSSRLGWIGESDSIEGQVRRCLELPERLALLPADAAARLQEDPAWRHEFDLLYADGPTEENLQRALGSFVRGLLSGNSAVDRFQRGDNTALDRDERQGMWLFTGKARCWQCHTGGTFSDEQFHNIGIGVEFGMPPDGRFAVTGNEAHRGAFQTPTLRNLAFTAPYMHDGSLASLADVVDYYRAGGNRNPWLDPALVPIALTDEEARQLVAFLGALSKP